MNREKLAQFTEEMAHIPVIHITANRTRYYELASQSKTPEFREHFTLKAIACTSAIKNRYGNFKEMKQLYESNPPRRLGEIREE